MDLQKFQDSTLLYLILENILVVTNDGAIFLGVLRGFDQTTNLILQNAIKRTFSENEGVLSESLGLYIMRGDSIAVVAEIDKEKDERTDWDSIKCRPISEVDHRHL